MEFITYFEAHDLEHIINRKIPKNKMISPIEMNKNTRISLQQKKDNKNTYSFVVFDSSRKNNGFKPIKKSITND